MDGGSATILVMVMIVAVAFGILQLESEAEIARIEPIPVENILTIALLSGERNWQVNITRRSGYLHDSWSVYGGSKNAIDTGIAKLRQARIFEVIVRENSANRLEVIAYYDSSGRRRTGKYVGGFSISPA